MSFPQMSIRWCFNISNWKPTFEQWKLAVQCVQKEECERCYRFAFVEDCKASMVGQLLMRKAANECLGLPYEEISFSRSSSGKPFLEESDGFDFNVSHHGDFCVLAAEHDSRVGVDVMKVEHRGKRSVAEFFSLMQRQFSSHEWSFIAQPGTESEQLSRFYRLWCLKESYVKAVGTGIVVDLRSLSFECPTPALRRGVVAEDTRLHEDGKPRSRWKFEETLLDDDHCVAVAHQENLDGKRRGGSKIFDFLTFNDLMQNSKPFVQEEEDFWCHFISKSEKKKL